jgi:hypothetical protein
MTVKRIKEGIYKVEDSQGTWIATGGFATMNGKWVAHECNTYEECTTLNSWAVQFDTFKQLKQYAKSF